MPRRTLLCGALLCLLSNWGCMVIPPSQDPDPEPPADCSEGEPFTCNDPRGCIRIEQNGSFENPGHWEIEQAVAEGEFATRFTESVTAVVDDAGGTATVRPCDGAKMLSFGSRSGGGSPSYVSQEIDVSLHSDRITDRSRVVAELLVNFMPPLGVDTERVRVHLYALREGEIVADNGSIGLDFAANISESEPWRRVSRWSLPLKPGVDEVRIEISGRPPFREVDSVFIDDVRVWLELNGPDAELELGMQADRSYALVGEPVSFTLTVTNRGTETAEGVRVSDVLPGELRYASQSGDGIYNPLTGVWDVDLGDATPTGDLLAGFSASLTITTTVTSLERITIGNQARISGGLVGDYNADNNRASFPVHLNEVAPPPPETPPGEVVISDAVFEDADWEVRLLGGSAADLTVTRRTNGGSAWVDTPDSAWRQMTNLLTGSTLDAHVYLGAAYNPRVEGAIDSVDYREDHIVFSSPADAFRFDLLAFAMVVVQDGRTYRSQSIFLTETRDAWRFAALPGMRPENFMQIAGDTTAPLNFIDGGEMQFGYLRTCEADSPGFIINDCTNVGGSLRHGIDNWTVTIHQAR